MIDCELILLMPCTRKALENPDEGHEQTMEHAYEL
jgi:hypothetical protein